MISFDSKIVTYAAIGMAIYFIHSQTSSTNFIKSDNQKYHKEIYDTTSRYSYNLDPKKSSDEMNYFEKFLVEKYKRKNSENLDSSMYVEGLSVEKEIPVKIGDRIYLSITPENSVYTENPAQTYVLGSDGELKKYEQELLKMKTGDVKFVTDENNKQVSLRLIGIIKQKENNND